MITKIIAGGQTGADRGGLDAAMQCGLPHGGWCPQGRKAEDGVIPAKYHLKEMLTEKYLPRTQANVLDSDATIIFTYGPLTGGSLKTATYAHHLEKPWHMRWIYCTLRRSKLSWRLCGGWLVMRN